MKCWGRRGTSAHSVRGGFADSQSGDVVRGGNRRRYGRREEGRCSVFNSRVVVEISALHRSSQFASHLLFALPPTASWGVVALARAD
jgi:hypothetical protein